MARPGALAVPGAGAAEERVDQDVRLAPPRKPVIVAPRPPESAASCVRSKARAEISTPAPNAITVAITCGRGRVVQPTRAPTTSAPPATMPHAAAMTHPVTSVSRPVRARRSLVGSAVPRTR